MLRQVRADQAHLLTKLFVRKVGVVISFFIVYLASSCAYLLSLFHKKKLIASVMWLLLLGVLFVTSGV